MGNSVRNNPADTKSVKKEGEEVLQALEQIPLQPMMKTMVTQVVTLQSVEDHDGADIHIDPCGGPGIGAGGDAQKESAAHGASTLERTPSRNCGLWRGACTEASFLAGTLIL